MKKGASRDESRKAPNGDRAIGRSGDRVIGYFRRVIWSQMAAPPPPIRAPIPAPFLPPTAAPTPAPTPADDPMMIALFFTDRVGRDTRSVRCVTMRRGAASRVTTP